MKYVLTIRKVFRFTALFFGINWLIAYLVRYSKPIECNSAKDVNLTSHEVETICFDRLLSRAKTDFDFDQNRKILWYERNYKKFHSFLTIMTVVFGASGLIWLSKRRDRIDHLRFHARHPVLRQMARDEEINLEDDPNGERRLVLSFKRAIQREDVQIIFEWSVAHAILGFFIIVIVLYGFYKYQEGITENVNGMSSGLKNVFPLEADCTIMYTNTNHTHTIVHHHDFPQLEKVPCKLLLNRFYEINQTLIWYYLLTLFIIVVFSIFQLFSLADSVDFRLERLAKLAPQVDKNLLEPFAYDRSSYFVLEERYSKLGKDQFGTLVRLLIEENYRLDLALKNVSYI